MENKQKNFRYRIITLNVNGAKMSDNAKIDKMQDSAVDAYKKSLNKAQICKQ